MGIYPVYILAIAFSHFSFIFPDRRRDWCKEVYLYMMEAHILLYIGHNSINTFCQNKQIKGQPGAQSVPTSGVRGRVPPQADKRINKNSFEDARLTIW